MTQQNKTLNEQEYEKNEILSKIIMEIIYRDDIDEMTDGGIDALLKRKDWKEITGFELTKDENGWWTSDPKIYPWVARVDRPLIIFKQLNNFKKIVTEIIKEYHKPVEDTPYWYEELIEKIENGEKSEVIKDIVEYWKKRAERGEEDAKIHLEALTEVSKKWNEKKLLHWVRFCLELNKDKDNLHSIEKKSLEKKVSNKAREVEEKTEMLRASGEKLLKEKSQNEELQKLLEVEKKEKKEILESFGEKLLKKDRKIEELEEQLCLVNKLLTGSKKSGKFKSLKEKIKTKSQQLVKKIKHQSQELIARIEVKTK